MGINDSSVAITALVIAIAAFITAFGQLLQQLFVTADGLRRCQNSVIGGWSQLVQLRFRWSSLRFEVRVVTPHFMIAPPGALLTSVRKWDLPPSRTQKLLWKHSRFWCDASEPVGMVGTTLSRTWTSLRTIENASTEEPVTWLSLIEDIHELQTHDSLFGLSGIRALPEHGELLSFIRHSRSWDFMPVEIVRPFASTTIGCLISIVHRMDLTWIEFKPDEGIIRATGHGRSISASRVRGLGLVVEYVRNGTRLIRSLDRRIESEEADKMACGILPLLNRRDLPLRDHSKPVEVQLSRAFGDLDDVTVRALNQSLAHKTISQALPGFADILGLGTAWLPISSTGTNFVENPFPIEVVPMGRRPEPRVVWRHLLQQYSGDSAPIKQLAELYSFWESRDPTRFQTLVELRTTSDWDYWWGIKTALKGFFDLSGFYWRLVWIHVAVNSQSIKQAEENIRNGLPRPRLQISSSNGQYQGDPIFTERAFVYVDNISKIVSEMESRWEVWEARVPSNEIEEAWWMMMLRMQTWNMSVNLRMREGMTIPHHYYGDPSRIYIL